MHTFHPSVLVKGFVAAESDVAVLVREGPPRKTLMVRWDLATNEFEIGQWLFVPVSGGMLSPDGRLLAYQVHNHKYNFYYNVVSRPPFFTALALWDIGSPYGEGLCWTEGNDDQSLPPPSKGTVPDEYRTRLALHGIASPWQGASDEPPRWFRSCALGEIVEYWEVYKPNWYSLNDEMLDADWADVDRHGRILLSRAGRVYVRDVDGEREMFDLNPFEFRPLEAPEWAKRWPES